MEELGLALSEIDGCKIVAEIGNGTLTSHNSMVLEVLQPRRKWLKSQDCHLRIRQESYNWQTQNIHLTFINDAYSLVFTFDSFDYR